MSTVISIPPENLQTKHWFTKLLPVWLLPKSLQPLYCLQFAQNNSLVLSSIAQVPMYLVRINTTLRKRMMWRIH
ncbi:hypothetical protein FGO68_gene3963 [Halteria grandinella]|uniref:Uncharacterized protein n=1 Tax=Halteria grandinella TaxID=5974 RepID=A0A8J8NX68_HALGN|nr:hypothetical protein FGO68_gene3963 [Halteria grandinella]